MSTIYYLYCEKCTHRVKAWYFYDRYPCFLEALKFLIEHSNICGAGEYSALFRVVSEHYLEKLYPNYDAYSSIDDIKFTPPVEALEDIKSVDITYSDDEMSIEDRVKELHSKMGSLLSYLYSVVSDLKQEKLT